MICFKNTYAFTVKTQLLQGRVATTIQIDLAKYYRSEVRSVAHCNQFNRKDKSLHDASLDCAIRSTSVNALKNSHLLLTYYLENYFLHCLYCGTTAVQTSFYLSEMEKSQTSQYALNIRQRNKNIRVLGETVATIHCRVLTHFRLYL